MLNNLIADNDGDGIHLEGASTTANRMGANVIGTSRDRTKRLGNWAGIRALQGAHRNVIGYARGDEPAAVCSGPCNVIMHNVAAGVPV